MQDVLNLDKIRVMYELQDLTAKLPQIKNDVYHSFTEGKYTRSLKMPKGSLVFGKRHKLACLNILAKGTIILYDEHTSTTMEAPYVFQGKINDKKAVYNLEDSIWMNVYDTNETNIEKLEEMLYVDEDIFRKEIGCQVLQ